MEIINIDWLKCEIGLFKKEKDYLSWCDELKIEPKQDRKEFDGFVQWIENDVTKEAKFIMVLISRPVSSGTVLHETSHMVDYLFEYFGFDACTETRAYFHQHLFEQTINRIKTSKKGR